jgi:oxygen-independent coproporphyrinogen-3 oxidase
MYYDKKVIKKYLIELENEIINTYKGEQVKTIYIGGGTPSSLDLDELKQLFNIIKIFNIEKLEEFTIECNIDSLDNDKLLLFKNNGINRLSIGVESFNNRLLNILGRDHSKGQVINIINESKNIGIDNINIDLIYGIDGETMDDLKKDIDILLSLDVPHISLYSLIIEPHTKLYINKFNEMDEDLNAEMYEYINDTLKRNNYIHYEISNYSKEGFQSKHNLVYWHNLEYYGFGLGASSFINDKRYDNTRSLNSYLDKKYIINTNLLTKKEMMENEMILGLRLLEGVEKELFFKKYNKSIEETFNIKKLFDSKMLIDNGKYIYIPEDKIFISNSVLIEFLD